MTTREEIIATLVDCLPLELDTEGDIREDSVLSDLGLSSLHLMTLLLTLRDRYDLDVSRISKMGTFRTVGDIVMLIERGSQPV